MAKSIGLLVVIFFIYGCDSIQNDWDAAVEENSLEAYADFKQKNPQSQFDSLLAEKINYLLIPILDTAFHHISNNSFDLAKHRLEQLLSIYDSSSIALNNYGVLLASEGKYDSALENFTRAIQFSDSQFINQMACQVVVGDSAYAVFLIAIQSSEADTIYNNNIWKSEDKKLFVQLAEAMKVPVEYVSVKNVYTSAIASTAEAKVSFSDGSDTILLGMVYEKRKYPKVHNPVDDQTGFYWMDMEIQRNIDAIQFLQSEAEKTKTE
jgi:tetratricopeptide (TPR) repeat protein